MNEFISRHLPGYYRLNLSEKLVAAIKNATSINIIGMPAVGKNTYLNFFLNRRDEFLKDKSERVFLSINLREFVRSDFNSFKKFFIKKLLHLETDYELKDPEGFLKDISSKHEVIVILRFLDELKSELIEKIFNFFLTIRQPPYRIQFIFLTNRPLSEYTRNSAAKGRLLSCEEYFQPASWDDFCLAVDRHESFLGLSFDRKHRQKLYELTGGHGGYLKNLMTYEKERSLKYLESDIYERVVSGDLPRDLIRRSEELVGKLNKSELAVLKSLSKGEKSRSLKIPKLLVNLGFVRKKRDEYVVFSKILTAFLKS
jgi:hypothetical protein